MLRIDITVGAHDAYHVPCLTLSATGHQLHIDFQPGRHVFTSQDLELGTIHAHRNVSLIGRLTFWYTYDTARNTISVCDADYESADGMISLHCRRAGKIWRASSMHPRPALPLTSSTATGAGTRVRRSCQARRRSSGTSHGAPARR